MEAVRVGGIRTMPDIDLSGVEIFSGFSPDQLATVRSMADEVAAEPGAVLMEQGDVGQEAFVIVSGQAAISVAGTRVATVGVGTIVGEMALLDGRPRSATVTAVTDCELLSFNHKRFQALVATMPAETVEMMADLSARMREANQTR